MDIFKLLAVFFATSTVFLFYALIAQSDTNKLLRIAFRQVHRAKLAQDSHLEACSHLLGYCQELERRNEMLEDWMSHFTDTLAGAKLMAPSIIREDERFTVREKCEAP